MCYRRLAGHAVPQKRAKGGAGFHPDIPFHDRSILRPRNFAEIIEGGEMGGEREISERNIARGEKSMPVGKLSKGGQRIAHRLAAEPDSLHVRG